MNVAEIKVSYSSNYKEKVKITNSQEAYDLIIKNWSSETIELLEEVRLVLLNRANRVLGIHKLSRGGVSQCIIDIKLVLSIALKCNASGLIIVHNHPSGQLIPSKSDKLVTTRLKDACKIVDLILLDHLIITKQEYYSFSDMEVI